MAIIPINKHFNINRLNGQKTHFGLMDKNTIFIYSSLQRHTSDLKTHSLKIMNGKRYFKHSLKMYGKRYFKQEETK